MIKVYFAAIIKLGSIGNLGPDENKMISAALAQLLLDKLNVPNNRYYVQFTDLNRAVSGDIRMQLNYYD